MILALLLRSARGSESSDVVTVYITNVLYEISSVAVKVATESRSRSAACR